MNRTNFYHKEIIDEIAELDFLHNALSKFTMQYPPLFYRVVGSDIMRPYLISYRFYGTVQFWWIIMAVNGISNPLCDMVSGQILKIPNRLDIYAFQKKYRIRRSM